MTDEELIKNLRGRNGFGWTEDAADRIEQLERERDDYAHKLIESNNTYTEMHIAIEYLEDKLAKAVKALRSYVSKEKGVWNTADAVLAELEKTE